MGDENIVDSLTRRLGLYLQAEGVNTEVSDEDDTEPFCYTCISSADFTECESCDHGWVEADDDDYDNIRECQWCNGKGGWWLCIGPERHDLEPGSIHRIPLDQRQTA